MRRLNLVAALLVFTVSGASAQSGYGISCWTVDGGGILASSGDGLTLAGTLGQPDAGAPLSGGSLVVRGGFWPAATGLAAWLSGGTFHSVTPCRMIDTRNPDGQLGGPALQAGAVRTFVLSGVCGVPASARALSVNLVVTQSAAAGYLSLMPGDQTGAPSTSSITYASGQTRANNALPRMALDGSGRLKVFSFSSAHFILDVNGYFE